MTLDARLEALAEALELAEGRLPAEMTAPAAAVVAKAGARLGFGSGERRRRAGGADGRRQVVSLQRTRGRRRLGGREAAPDDVRLVVSRLGLGRAALLDWLDVRRRHRVGGPPDGLDGLVLLDLPDFDSVERSHRVEVDRLLELVDLVVWVVDPQKYADAAWHDGYLGRLDEYGASTAVVLNQVDLLTPGAAAAAEADLRRLLGNRGLDEAPVLHVSVRTGEGVDAVRALLAERVEAREAAIARLAADVRHAVAALAPACGGSVDRSFRSERDRLVDALAEAAGVPTVVRAVEQAHRRRGALATGWPLVRWLSRLRPDPLRRLRLAEEPQELVRTSLPGPSPAATARVESAARALAAAAAHGLPEPWPRRVRDVDASGCGRPGGCA